METIGRYEIIEEIGRGGMGTVFRANDTLLGREIALKLLSRHLSEDPSFAERFRREAQIIAQLEHAHIVPIYDFGVHENQPYLVMRLLTNGTLRTRIEEHPIAPDDLWPIMTQVAAALDLAHSKEIVHRDMKPTNILFGNQGGAFVSDFGIAKVLSSHTELTGSALIGSPAYMSPEQFMSDGIDGRSDQYSLAIVIFEALTGRLPYKGDTARVMYQHLQSEPPDIHTHTDLPPQATAVFHRALSKDPKNRFHTVSEFIGALAATSHLAPGDPLPETKATTIIRPEDLPPLRKPTPLPPVDKAPYSPPSSRPPEPEPEPVHPDTDSFGVAPTADDEKRSTQSKIVKGAGGEPTREIAVWQRPPILVGGLVLLAVIIAAIFFLRPQDETAEIPSIDVQGTADAETATADANMTPDITPIAVVPGSGGLDWQLGDERGQLSAAGDVPYTDGNLLLQNGNGVSAVTLPDQTQIFLDSNTMLTVQTIARTAVEQTAIKVDAGIILVATDSRRIDITTDTEDRASAESSSLMAISHQETPFWFQADCLTGNCTFAPQGEEPTRLVTGQAMCIFGQSCEVSGVITTIDYATYGRLSPIVPTPTLAPTPTPTASPTPRPTETPTAEAPTLTATPTPITVLQVRVIQSSINLRNGPGTRYSVVGILRQDDIVTVIAGNRDNTWYLIERADDDPAWLSEAVVEPVTAFNVEDIATAVTIPAPPTFTPTPTPLPPTPIPSGGDDDDDGGPRPTNTLAPP